MEAVPHLSHESTVKHWSQLSDSNRQPLDYKSRALPIEAKLAYLAAATVCPITEKLQVEGGENPKLGLVCPHEYWDTQRSEATGASCGHDSGFSGRISQTRASGSH